MLSFLPLRPQGRAETGAASIRWLGLGICILYAVVGLSSGEHRAAGLCMLLAASALSRHPRMVVLWPLAFWAAGYTAFIRILQARPDRYIDSILAAADARLFSALSLAPLSWSLGQPVEELANALYFSFYLVVPLALLHAARRGRSERAGAALTAAFSLCALIWLLAPSGGYHAAGSPDGTPWGPFTEVVRAIYAANPHFAAAFPSSHVALSVIAAGILGGRWWGWLWALGVAWSTVYGQYHFLIDAPTGWMVGLASLQLTSPRLAPAPRSVLRRWTGRPGSAERSMPW